MNRNSPIPLWAVLCVGVVFVGGIYVLAQRSVTPLEAVINLRRSTVLPAPKGSVSTAPDVTALARNSTTSTISNLQNTCRNEQRRFQLMYPSTWKMYSPGPPEARPITCNEAGDIMFWGPDIYEEADSPRLNLDIFDDSNDHETEFEHAETLSEYLRLNPERSAHIVKRSATKDGTPLLRFDDGMWLTSAQHAFFVFTPYKVEPTLLTNIMQTFEFLQ